ncbi:MAG: hypothetical protein AAFX76_13825, partial [Planctomycetota bacterium]
NIGGMPPLMHSVAQALCIKGGIPPMFLTRDRDGGRELYLLTDAEGGAVFDPIEPYIADAIEAEGVIERHGDLSWFRIEPATIRRLD